MKSLMLKILRGSYPPISAKYSYDVRNLVSALLRKKPSERPSLGAIFRKRFVAAAEEELVRSQQHKVRRRKARSR
jgi:NIMA (never in mitosis gene a)-related kinase